MNNIAICFDDGYTSGAISLINSIRFYNDRPCFYILHNGLSKSSEYRIEKCLEGCEHKVIGIKISSSIPKIRYFSPISCGRLYIADYIDIDKCVYLDCDTLCLSDLDFLFNLQLKNKIIGAVLDPRYSNISQQLSQMPKNKIPNYLNERPAFNSGVLVINLELWRKNDLTKKVVDWISTHNHYLTLPDQAALNFFIEGNFHIIEKKWNVCLYKTKLKKDETMSILHFNGQVKPWTSKNTKYGELWWSFYEQGSLELHNQPVHQTGRSERLSP